MTRRIDAHHHLWDLAVRDQPWMVADTMASIRRSFGIDEFAAEARSNGVDSSVLVQTVADVTETEELLELAAASTLVAGVVGWVDVGATDVGDQLDRVLALPSGSWLVGIRSVAEYEPDPAWLARPAVLAGLREVARRDLCNDLLVLPHQLNAAVTATREVSEGRFVLDHLAKPPIAAGEWQPWAGELSALARNDNVSAKISGLVTEADWSAWTPGSVRPYVDHALSVFGPDRLVFGSDWPVCTLAASYGRIVDLADQFIEELSTDEQAAVLSANATKIYSLDNAGRGTR
ncbi:MAG TPA: amidohydrolase family protein [Ilumatobacteraceae bacterium]|nr:amidohydrolase family protein [Ilumatobacteraceae bacterium]